VAAAFVAAAFVAAAFVAAAFVAAAFMAAAFAAVGDRTIWIRWLAINTPKLVIWQSYIPEGGLFIANPTRRSRSISRFFKDWGIKVGLRGFVLNECNSP
jgi:hypothetical protein